ncbi:helix-turn-helix domain-containing protein [Glaciihabitans sp. GrIS 2.15]|uniref:helix-turn-helix domain-containing protein n=1 Tax=Glaciihabitans sp. GrIS 2.15 TaxID=3071710 RepID=UPI002E08F48A|nr:excisionase family DNA binding protein [Glaciihabitans sp. GrIS 2.15]
MTAPTTPAPGDNETARYLLSQDEAAHMLSISRTTLWRLVKLGELETVAIGSRRLITVSTIEDFIARNLSSKTDERGYPPG